MIYSIIDRETDRDVLAGATEARALAFCRGHRRPEDLLVTATDPEDISPCGDPEIAGQINGVEFAADPSSIFRAGRYD